MYLAVHPTQSMLHYGSQHQFINAQSRQATQILIILALHRHGILYQMIQINVTNIK